MSQSNDDVPVLAELTESQREEAMYRMAFVVIRPSKTSFKHSFKRCYNQNMQGIFPSYPFKRFVIRCLNLRFMPIGLNASGRW